MLRAFSTEFNNQADSPKDTNDSVVQIDVVEPSCRDPDVEKVHDELVSNGCALSVGLFRLAQEGRCKRGRGY